MYVTECDVRRAAWWSPPPVRFETCSENITFEPSFPSTGAACRNCWRKQSWRTGYEAQAHLDNHRGRSVWPDRCHFSHLKPEQTKQ